MQISLKILTNYLFNLGLPPRYVVEPMGRPGKGAGFALLCVPSPKKIPINRTQKVLYQRGGSEQLRSWGREIATGR